MLFSLQSNHPADDASIRPVTMTMPQILTHELTISLLLLGSTLYVVLDTESRNAVISLAVFLCVYLSSGYEIFMFTILHFHNVKNSHILIERFCI